MPARPPDAIREPLATFVFRRRQGFRTEDALTDLADALAHPTSDAAIAAIRLVVSGTAGAWPPVPHRQRAWPLPRATRCAPASESIARASVYLSSMKRLVMIAALLIGYLRLAAGDLLDPYTTGAGQLFLALPLAMWAGCVMWLRSLCRYEVPQRYRIIGSES